MHDFLFILIRIETTLCLCILNMLIVVYTSDKLISSVAHHRSSR